MSVVTGKRGATYECPVHGRFVPTELPRYSHERPEAKCMAWLNVHVYCGIFAPLVEAP